MRNPFVSYVLQSLAVAGAAALLAAPAVAQTTASTPAATPALMPRVIDGDMWLQASPEARRAFLAGAVNMIALESAYSRKRGTPRPAPDSAIAAAMQGMTLDQVAGRVTRWYEANPGRRTLPVMGAVWLDMVAPRAAAGGSR